MTREKHTELVLKFLRGIAKLRFGLKTGDCGEATIYINSATIEVTNHTGIIIAKGSKAVARYLCK